MKMQSLFTHLLAGKSSKVLNSNISGAALEHFSESMEVDEDLF